MDAMSLEAARAFLAELESDQRLRAELLAPETGPAGPLTLSTHTLAERAARRGYTFSTQELFDAISRHSAAARSELRDAELETVTGGSKNEVAIETLEIVHEGFGDGSGASCQTLRLTARPNDR
jgi:predicted ribosomally synthesized peptide with nif11-like leader